MSLHQLEALFSRESGRLWFTAFFFALFLTSAWSQQRRVLVVLPALEQAAHGKATDSVVDKLKAARAALGVEPGGLPILRLDPTKKNHRQVLTKLGLSRSSLAVIAVCSQAASGWPSQVVKQFSEEDPPRLVIERGIGMSREQSGQIDRTERIASSQEPSKAVANVGILLIRDSEQPQQVELTHLFLRELGRHWMERYGRVRPSPYPLASYDFSDPVVRERVSKSFSELADATKPLVCLALFEDRRPIRVLDVFEEVQTPATLVRRLSGVRGRHLAETIDVGDGGEEEVPEASVLTMTDDLESALLLGRVQESARQLWSGMDDGPDGVNRLARRALLAIVQAIDDQQANAPVSQALRSALEDFQAEKILLPPDSELQGVLSRLRALTTTLLESK